MRIPVSIFKKFVETDKNSQEIADILTSIGLEVEEIISREDLKDFVVAEIKSFEKHPNADKLNICKVWDGKKELQIVCGASNVRAGMKVILANVGVVVPNGNFKIKEAKIRGVESFGMLCSYSELNINENSEGIADLSDEFIVGQFYSKQAGFDDAVIDLSLTPNRGDCASVYGVARDFSARTGEKFNKININITFEEKKDNFITINTEKCTKYTGLKVYNVDVIPSPKFVKSALDKFDINTRNILVDITNYVMMVYGQPMHCFDADKIIGNITVDEARDGEKFLDLKDVEHILQNGDIIIRDNEKIIALAGIIGSKSSCVDENTKNIVLEAANFDKIQVSKTSQRVKISTDAKFRFERGVDCSMIDFAIDFAKKHILENCSNAYVKSYDSKGNDVTFGVINYNFATLNKISGLDISSEKQIEIINKLGFEIVKNLQDGVEVKMNSARQNIETAKDLAEDILRIYGFDAISFEALPYFESKYTNSNFEKELVVKKLVSAMGYDEVIALPFISKDDAVSFGSKGSENLIKLYNPIALDSPFLRNSALSRLFGKICDFVSMDSNYEGKIFEIANVFSDECKCKSNLGMIKLCSNNESIYKQNEQKSAFLSMKSELFEVLNLFGIREDRVEYSEIDSDFAHPFASFLVKHKGISVASFGFMNPIFLEKFGISKPVLFAELFDINSFSAKRKSDEYEASNLQCIYREFSFILDKIVKVGDIIKSAQKSSDSIISVALQDIYEDDKLGENCHAVSIFCKIEQREKTLTSEEIDAISDKLITDIVSQFSAKLRNGVK